MWQYIIITQKLLIYIITGHYAGNKVLSCPVSHPILTAACRGGHDCSHFTDGETKAQGSEMILSPMYHLGLENHALGRWFCKVGRAWLRGRRRPVLESGFNTHLLGSSVQVSALQGLEFPPL